MPPPVVTLLDRLLGTDNLTDDDEKIPVHALAGLLFQELDGRATRADILSTLDLLPREEAALDEIRALITGTRINKVTTILQIWTVLLVGESGKVGKPKVKEWLGLTNG